MEWVTVAEAVKRTGRSERTIRRWMAAGKLPRQDNLVGLPDDAVQVDMTATGEEAATPDAPEVASLAAEVTRLQALLAQVTGERDRLWQALNQAQAIAMAMQKQIPEKAESVQGRPWWRFW